MFVRAILDRLKNCSVVGGNNAEDISDSEDSVATSFKRTRRGRSKSARPAAKKRTLVDRKSVAVAKASCSYVGPFSMQYTV